MRLMALDVGERRVGIAFSDSGIFASPHSVLNRKSKKEDFARLQRLAAELQVERIIVGLPYSVSGFEEMGPQARRVKRYGDMLAEVVDIPLEYIDESYSTADASAFLNASGKKKIPIDAAAAAVILQRYLDKTNNVLPAG